MSWKARRRDGRQCLYVVLMDLNGFKQINDKFGHTAGDQALRQAAQLLRRCCQREDFLARYGGDEFLVVAERERAADIPVLIDRFRGVMDQFNRRGEEPYALSVSAGCARWEDGYPTLDAFIADADERMYEDKRRWKQNHGPSGIGVDGL